MISLRKTIFGKHFFFHCSDYWAEDLKESLELYPSYSPEHNESEIEVFINELSADSTTPRSQNPTVFKQFDKGFSTDFGLAEINWELDEGLLIRSTITIKNPFQNRLRGLVKKARSMEFPRRAEWFEQVLHELFLIPAVHFMPDRAIIHASCVANANGALVLSGTGGVGKSSALLSIVEDDVGFLADDILVVDNEGYAYGNMAWPKVYGYNCAGNDMSSRVLKGRGLIDKLHFIIKNKINPKGVRRKIKPNELFSACYSQKIPIKSFIFLFKNETSNLELSSTNTDNFSSAIIDVINSEYQVFHKFIIWHAYNTMMSDVPKLVSLEDINLNWANILGRLPGRFDIKKLNIPFHQNHGEYQEYIRKVILSELAKR
jgi:hypothetical protein